MSEKLVISSNPHIHSGNSISKCMYQVILALVPAYILGLYFFGIGALIVTLVSITSCVFFEYIIQKYMLKKTPTITDGSAILTGLLLGFNLPSNLPWWIVVIGALVAIGIGKMTFGGLGKNIFNPALVGRVFLLISFPVQMTTWPRPMGFQTSYLDAQTMATPLSYAKAVIKGNTNLMSQIPDNMDLFLGMNAGSLGEISALALLVGGLFLIIRRVIHWQIPVSILSTVFVFTLILHLINPSIYMSPVTHLLTGGLMLGSFFMATDYVTSPMSSNGMLLYGFLIGVITVVIRVWGAYPEGMSFAILIMNAVTPLINNYIKPKRF